MSFNSPFHNARSPGGQSGPGSSGSGGFRNRFGSGSSSTRNNFGSTGFNAGSNSLNGSGFKSPTYSTPGSSFADASSSSIYNNTSPEAGTSYNQDHTMIRNGMSHTGLFRHESARGDGNDYAGRHDPTGAIQNHVESLYQRPEELGPQRQDPIPGPFFDPGPDPGMTSTQPPPPPPPPQEPQLQTKSFTGLQNPGMTAAQNQDDGGAGGYRVVTNPDGTIALVGSNEPDYSSYGSADELAANHSSLFTSSGPGSGANATPGVNALTGQPNPAFGSSSPAPAPAAPTPAPSSSYNLPMFSMPSSAPAAPVGSMQTYSPPGVRNAAPFTPAPAVSPTQAILNQQQAAADAAAAATGTGAAQTFEQRREESQRRELEQKELNAG